MSSEIEAADAVDEVVEPVAPAAPAAKKEPEVAAVGDEVIEGTLAGKEPPRFLKVLFGITGISFIIYLVKLFIRWVLGRKRQGRLRLEGSDLVLEERVRFVGREVRRSQEAFGRSAVVSVRLDTRYPYALTLLGLVGLGIGVVVGIVFLLDGIQGEFTPWILSGVGVLLAGIVMDLVFTTIASSLPGKTTLVLRLPEKRVVRLVGCDPDKATRVVRWLHDKG